MARKVILDLDPGIGDALAAVAALCDPHLDVVALTAVGGAVEPSKSSRNVLAIVEQLDPQRRPKIGFAHEGDPVEPSLSEFHRRLQSLHGATGLGDWTRAVPELHHRHESAKLLVDLVRDQPHEITLVTLGPLTNVAVACDRCPGFLSLLDGLVVVGGSASGTGDVTPAAEFNIHHDPEAARHVLSSAEPKTLIPLEAAERVSLTFAEFEQVCGGSSAGAQFLRRLLPHAFRAHHQVLGFEGLPLRELLGVAAVARPFLFQSRRLPVDVETHGELTRGATICDRRPRPASEGEGGRAFVVEEVDTSGIVAYLAQVLGATAT